MIYILPSLFVIVFGLGAAFSCLSQNHKDVLLGSDTDGWWPVGLGAVLLVLGFLIPDYTSGYLLKGLGILFAVFGGLILVDDNLTQKILNPILGFLYLAATFMVYYIGAEASGAFVYNTRALLTLVPFVTVATIALTLTVLSFMSAKFKSRLAQDSGAGVLIITGVFAVAVSPLAALNPALIISTSALGGLLITLGALIVVNDDTVEMLLTKVKAIAYAILTGVALYLARRLF